MAFAFQVRNHHTNGVRVSVLPRFGRKFHDSRLRIHHVLVTYHVLVTLFPLPC
jgi:hypothetical protein